jgi:hypothetical protein
LTESRSAFEQYQALKLVWDDVEALALDQGSREPLKAALTLVLQRHAASQAGDRHHLGSDRLHLARLALEAFGG